MKYLIKFLNYEILTTGETMKRKIILATGLLTSMLWADFTLEYKMDDNINQLVQYKDAQL